MVNETGTWRGSLGGKNTQKVRNKRAVDGWSSNDSQQARLQGQQSSSGQPTTTREHFSLLASRHPRGSLPRGLLSDRIVVVDLSVGCRGRSPGRLLSRLGRHYTVSLLLRRVGLLLLVHGLAILLLLLGHPVLLLAIGLLLVALLSAVRLLTVRLLLVAPLLMTAISSASAELSIFWEDQEE